MMEEDENTALALLGEIERALGHPLPERLVAHYVDEEGDARDDTAPLLDLNGMLEALRELCAVGDFPGLLPILPTHGRQFHCLAVSEAFTGEAGVVLSVFSDDESWEPLAPSLDDLLE